MCRRAKHEHEAKLKEAFSHDMRQRKQSTGYVTNYQIICHALHARAVPRLSPHNIAQTLKRAW
jgi:hypothetical protein